MYSFTSKDVDKNITEEKLIQDDINVGKLLLDSSEMQTQTGYKRKLLNSIVDALNYEFDIDIKYALEKYKWNVCFPFHCSRKKICEDPSYKWNQTQPPCCMDVMRWMVEDIDSFFKLYNISYFLAFGTLLGAIRNQSIIPWTQDVDISIECQDTIKLNKDVNIAKHLWLRGYFLFGDDVMERICLLKHWKNSILEPYHWDLPYGSLLWKFGIPYIDNYRYQEKHKKCDGYLSWYTTKVTLLPLSTAKMYGRIYPAPYKPHDLLRIVYGDYMVPDYGKVTVH